MLKILIIDDDTLTRKGIRMMMPWKRHDMQVVGEAPNGKAALSFLSENEVDLALVDLDMPIMDGTAFIQEASRLYPSLNYVVLTIHTEFEYIQEILRLGAIDYIAKTQFDKENFDSILDRIQAGIARKSSASQNTSLKWKDSKILYPYIYALVNLDTDNEESVFQFWELNNLSRRSDIYEVMQGVFLFTDDRRTFQFPESFINTMLLCISDVYDMTYAQVAKILRNYIKGSVFYDYKPIRRINHKRLHELSEDKYITDEATLKKLKENLISLNWIHQNELFDQFCIDLKESKLKFSQLYHLLLSFENVWNASYSKLTGKTITLPASFHHFEEVEQWLMDAYETINLFSSSSRYSEDIVKNILNAKNYVDNNFSDPINPTEIARSSHMSYGYFSRCFHDIIGVSFSDYCIQVRIEQGKDLLISTTKSILQIANDIGYNDEKYFSRLFKKCTGMSPSEYRKVNNISW